MAEIRVGDLVNWCTGEKTKVGVVRGIDPDGSCVIDVTTAAGRFEERINPSRLTRLTSTTESQDGGSYG
ncbi:MAG: hypothetical protein NT045_06785 [Candidatus Aureabacteria bacterium]|nr:hypothetical protein [Candidatus Auribacterota bacterium]